MVCRAANGIAEPHGGTAAALAYGFKVLADDSSARQAGLGEGGDAVTIMTIHGSKGLQFPFVILADLNRRGRNQSDPYYFAPGDTSKLVQLRCIADGLFYHGIVVAFDVRLGSGSGHGTGYDRGDRSVPGAAYTDHRGCRRL